jgi:hypothetical protein
MTVRLGAFALLVALAQVACATACTPPSSSARPAASNGPAQSPLQAQPVRTSASAEAPPVAVDPVAPVSSDRAARVIEAGEWIDSASKKLNKDDGAGCLADLDRARALDPKTEARAAATRAMCEMASGKCQTGKERADAWYRENTRLAPEMVAKTVEGMASMYCREGDMTPRDQVLQAVYDLSQGAYMTTKDPAWCSSRVAKIRKLSTTVSPRDDRDEQIKNALTVACTAGPACLGRAGDCPAAWKAFTQSDCTIAQNIAKVPDAVERKKAMIQAFESIVADCKGKAP